MTAQFEHPAFPREIADAPDIDNVPAASSMHALMECVREIYHGVCEIQDALSPEAHIERMRVIAPAAFELAREYGPEPSEHRTSAANCRLNPGVSASGNRCFVCERETAFIEAGPATPAPLDPSKVKAGDTVTVDVNYDPNHMPPFSVTGETYRDSTSSGLAVGGWGLARSEVTLTAHQPAPEPEVEWKPGTVGTATLTVGADEGSRRIVVRLTGNEYALETIPLVWADLDGNRYAEAEVTDFVPGETRPMPTREQVERVLRNYSTTVTRYREPGDFGAVDHYATEVMDLFGGESR